MAMLKGVWQKEIPPPERTKSVRLHALIYVNGTTYVQPLPAGVILAYNVWEPSGKPEGVNVLGAEKVPADSVAAASV